MIFLSEKKYSLSDFAVLYDTTLVWVLKGEAILSSVHSSKETSHNPIINSALSTRSEPL